MSQMPIVLLTNVFSIYSMELTLMHNGIVSAIVSLVAWMISRCSLTLFLSDPSLVRHWRGDQWVR